MCVCVIVVLCLLFFSFHGGIGLHHSYLECLVASSLRDSAPRFFGALSLVITLVGSWCVIAGFRCLPLQNHPRLVFVRPRTTGVLGSREDCPSSLRVRAFSLLIQGSELGVVCTCICSVGGSLDPGLVVGRARSKARRWACSIQGSSLGVLDPRLVVRCALCLSARRTGW